MEKGTRVQVSTPHLTNYLLEGKVVQEAIASNGQQMSKVNFSASNQAWYSDQALKKISPEHSQETIY
jgi:hypothetical protein